MTRGSLGSRPFCQARVTHHRQLEMAIIVSPLRDGNHAPGIRQVEAMAAFGHPIQGRNSQVLPSQEVEAGG